MDIVIYILTLLVSIFLLVIAYWRAGIFALMNTLLSLIAMTIIINDGGITYTQSAYNSASNTWVTTTVNYISVDVALLPFVFLLMISLFGVARGLRRD